MAILNHDTTIINGGANNFLHLLTKSTSPVQALRASFIEKYGFNVMGDNLELLDLLAKSSYELKIPVDKSELFFEKIDNAKPSDFEGKSFSSIVN